jgi:transcriptional regulator with XRE-family HTH domain
MARNTGNILLIPGLGAPAVVEVLGRRLRAERLAQNLSQSELAARAGITVWTLQRIEAGANVGIEAVIALALALRLDSDLHALFTPRAALPATIDAIVEEQRPRTRGGYRKGAHRAR